MKIVKLLICICVMSGMFFSTKVYASFFEYDDAQAVIDEYTSSEFNISDTVDSFVAGKGEGLVQNFIKVLKEGFVREIVYNKDSLIKVIFIAIGTAILSNFSSAFGSEGASETGVMMSYIIMTGYLFAGFSAIYDVATETIEAISIFIKTMVPAYFIAIGATGATASAAALYEIALFTVTIMCEIVGGLLLPAVMIYVVLMIVNNIQSKNYLSKLAELVKTLIQWGIKSIMGIVVGINVIQSIILPSVDAVTGKTVTKVVNLIPGIGNSAGTVAELIVGSGIVIKNAIGMTIVIGLIFICASPVVKILVYILMYKLAGALIEPVSDGRINESIDAVTEGGRMLLKITIYAIALFVVSIAVICIATNVK